MLNTVTKIAGLVLLFLLILTAVGPANLAYYIDIPSIAIVVLGTCSLLCACFGLKGYIATAQALLGKESSCGLGAKFTNTGMLASVGMGAFGTLVGIVLMLQNLDDPSKLGPGMAVSMLCHIYGIIQALIVFLPMRCAIAQNNPDDSIGNIPVVGTGLMICVMPLINLGMLLFLLIDLS